MVEVGLGHGAAVAPLRGATIERVAARRGAGEAGACRRRFEREGDEPDRVADSVAAPERIPWLATRCVAELCLCIAVGAWVWAALRIDVMLVGRQRRRTDRVQPEVWFVRRCGVEDSPAGRVGDNCLSRTTMTCRALASLGDRRARRRGQRHKEQSGRKREEEVRAAKESRPVTARSRPPPR